MPRTSCPFCNAAFDAPEAGPANCPRCREALPGRGPSSPPLISEGTTARPRRWVVPTIVFALLGVGTAVITLLNTQKVRDDRRPPTPTVTAPADLRGLAFLPPATNVAFAVQPGPILDYAGRTNQSPIELLTRAGVPSAVLGSLGSAGVPLDAIDHVAGGVFVPDADLGELRLGLALVLRQPLADEAKFLDALKARPTPGTPGKYSVEFGGLPLKLAKAADDVWLLGWADRDVTPSGNGLGAAMRAALGETLSTTPCAWLLTDTTDWAAKRSLALLLSFGAKGAAPNLSRVRAAAAWLNLEGNPTYRVMVRVATPADRAALVESFRATPDGRAGEIADWAFLDSPADRPAGLAALRQLLTAPPR